MSVMIRQLLGVLVQMYRQDCYLSGFVDVLLVLLLLFLLHLDDLIEQSVCRTPPFSTSSSSHGLICLFVSRLDIAFDTSCLIWSCDDL